jgi:predicted small secreted protein
MLKVITAVAFATVMLAGCETLKGAGHDVSNAGHVVTDTADHTQKTM